MNTFIEESVVSLDPKTVHVSKLNIRQPAGADVAELMESIRATGQITPAIVRPHPKKQDRYELVAGARRKVACAALGVPLRAIVREVPDEEFEDLILTENLQREDPDPMQEALLLERRIAAGAAPSEIAARYGKTDSWVRRRMKLISLTESAREAWKPGGAFSHFTCEMMEFIGTLPPAEQNEHADNTWGMRDFETLKDLTDSYHRTARKLDKAEWLLDPCTFVEGCGPGCANNSADTLFPDEQNPCGSCLNSECFIKRLTLWKDHLITSAIGDRTLGDLVILSGNHLNQISYKGENFAAVPKWEQTERFRLLKKERKGAFAALDLADPAKPGVRWIMGKEGVTLPAATTLETKKESREDRVTGKRLALLNQSLATAVKDSPLPTVSILKIVAAFGMQGNRGSSDARTINATWESIDSSGLVPPLDCFVEEPQTPEEILWDGVKPVIASRLVFHRNSDLLDEARRNDMERIADLIGFDHAARWTEICTREVPVPKSWGTGFDPFTLQPKQSEAA